jgi:protoporphyrinogen oxidase
MDLEIAVVGGGASGTYSAWRLQEAQGGSDRIALFEYSDRIGGRLFTVTMPGLPNVKAEVGGMRYIKDAHPVVTNIVEHLGLDTMPFPMGAPALYVVSLMNLRPWLWWTTSGSSSNQINLAIAALQSGFMNPPQTVSAAKGASSGDATRKEGRMPVSAIWARTSVRFI